MKRPWREIRVAYRRLEEPREQFYGTRRAWKRSEEDRGAAGTHPPPIVGRLTAFWDSECGCRLCRMTCLCGGTAYEARTVLRAYEARTVDNQPTRPGQSPKRQTAGG